jgi:diguanylate cyclase (GGDEF)-like protein
MLLRQMDRARGNGEALSLLLLDVDHFKRFNDQQGHVAGDYALQGVAACLRDAVRPTDLLARFGGEEFAVLLPCAGAGDARQIGDRLREAVSELRLSHPERGTLPGVTISVGIASLQREQSRDGFLEHADRALYRAKQGGRDRVCE